MHAMNGGYDATDDLNQHEALLAFDEPCMRRKHTTPRAK
jgi:hypothetical protein